MEYRVKYKPNDRYLTRRYNYGYFGNLAFSEKDNAPEGFQDPIFNREWVARNFIKNIIMINDPATRKYLAENLYIERTNEDNSISKKEARIRKHNISFQREWDKNWSVPIRCKYHKWVTIESTRYYPYRGNILTKFGDNYYQVYLQHISPRRRYYTTSSKGEFDIEIKKVSMSPVQEGYNSSFKKTYEL